MRLRLNHASTVTDRSASWYQIFPTDNDGKLRRTTRAEAEQLQDLEVRISTMAKRSLGDWFRGTEFNPSSKTLELCFTKGVSSNPSSRRRFAEFCGWLALFSEESLE